LNARFILVCLVDGTLDSLMGKFEEDYRGGVGKSGVLEHKSGNISDL